MTPRAPPSGGKVEEEPLLASGWQGHVGCPGHAVQAEAAGQKATGCPHSGADEGCEEGWLKAPLGWLQATAC